MAEGGTQYFFGHKAIVEDLIKRQNLHEGHWMMTLEIGLKGTNLPVILGEGAPVLTPAGIVHIYRIGITRTREPNDLSVDAGKVNPIKKSQKNRPGKKSL